MGDQETREVGVPNSDTENDDEEEDNPSEIEEFIEEAEEAKEEINYKVSTKEMYSYKKFSIQELVPVNSIIPKPRSGHRIIYHKGKIFSFGGYNPSIDQHDPDLVNDDVWASSKPLFKELWELNLSTGVWTRCEMRGKVR